MRMLSRLHGDTGPRPGRRAAATLLLALALALFGAEALAQDADGSGSIRIQRRELQGTEELAPLGPEAPLMDFREEMRIFVQNISAYARDNRRDFTIVTEDALPLLVKRDQTSDSDAPGLPARTYMRSIDGVLVRGLYVGYPAFNKPQEEEDIQARRLKLAEIARENGLKVLVMDHTDQPGLIDAGYRRAKQSGFVYTSAPSPYMEAVTLPQYPDHPFDENPRSIVSLRSVENFAYVGDSPFYGRQDEFALTMHGTNYDLLVVDVFHNLEPLTKRAVETLKYKKLGAKRLVFARVDIGTAASYRYYWKPNWRPGSPVWINAPLSNNPDAYYVEYWRPEWQQIIFGDTQSYIYGVIDQGYDGVILSGLDAYEFFERGGDPQATLP